MARKSRASTEKVFQKLKPLTDGQADYMDAIEDCDIIACRGPAGTGKSYIAVGLAIEMLKDPKNGFEKIVIVRPLIECGSKIGALPGDLDEKVGPYMAALYDIFSDFLSLEDIERMKLSGIIDIQPLELMRGKTFKKTIVIVDEVQNATYIQQKMVLTRFGDNSKMILCGDETQSDNRYNIAGINKINSFDFVCNLLEEIKDDAIAVITLNIDDVVRHRLVKKIVEKFP